MRTGCQPPYRNGTGGFCGCNCKCCPPKCCAKISVYFRCGAPQSDANPSGCVFTTPSCTPVGMAEPPLTFPDLPEFNFDPILSEDNNFTLGGGSLFCSVPCQTICVEIKCGGITPCCCLQLKNGKILAVGNGYVTSPTTASVPGCQDANVYINGFPPPVFINDGDEVVVTLVTNDTFCCCCEQINAVCGPCALMTRKPLWVRKVDPRTGQPKLDPRTKRPILAVNKKELMKRIFEKYKSSRRRK